MINHNTSTSIPTIHRKQKELPEMIQKRLSELSSSEDWFKPEVTEYNESLKAAEYSPTLEFIYPDKPNNIQTISK